ncbi:ATP-binding protein [Nitrospira defluvii]|uniref:AAA domain-containing protein n=1 Tax=Nitrospira defluvii TaxID=330214 RepID=A0ABN7LMJ0_9BACT|nr:ATP-binding protein [Nitrospira defluvii]CAE6753308.1 AAA domain-containing protein [Nitrospira defluvii]
MRETLLENEQAQAFLLAHPYQKGWKVYRYTEAIAAQLFLCFLPDYLRDHCPQAISRRELIRHLSDDELFDAPFVAHATPAGNPWDVKLDLNGSGWRGLLEFEWADFPIHILASSLSARYSWTDVFTVATQSNRALRSLHQSLAHYARNVRMKGRPGRITVINGDDVDVRSAPWDDLLLPPGMVEDIRTSVEGFFRSEQTYQQLGLPHRRGFLFTGPPGCGKTATIRALTTHTSATFVTVDGRYDVEDYHVERALNLANQQSPAVVILEDLDKLISSNRISLAHLLNLLDGLREFKGVLVIATSNEPQKLDPALLHRPSRFDRIWRFPLPRYEQRLELLVKVARGQFSMAAVQEVARQSEGFSMAYVQEIVVNALLRSVDRGGQTDDDALTTSLATMEAQRKSAAKSDDVAARESVGFACSG